MASIIRIKRSSVSGNPGTLGAGELAYSNLTDNGSNGGDRLYIGMGIETGGNAANHVVIGGKFFTDRLDHTAGTLTASSAIVVDENSKIDNLKVDNLDLNGNTISSTDTNGDILITPNGTGKTVITNVYIGDTSTSLAEYIYDTVGGAITAGTGITITNSDGGNTSTVSITNTSVTAGSYGSSTAIPTFTVNAQGQLTAAGTADVATALSIAGDSGTDTISLLTETLTISGGTGLTAVAASGTSTITVSLDNTAVTAGSYGSSTSIPTFTVDQQGRLTAAGSASISTTLSVAADSGTGNGVALASDTLTISGGEGIDTSISGDTVTIAAEIASDTNKGVASFNTSGFVVTTGDVALKSNVVQGVTTDSGALTVSGNAISILGGEGMDVTHSGTTITVAGEDASDTNKGIASFSSSNFTVTSGAVVTKNITLGSSTLTNGSTTSALAGLTQLDVDNIRVDGNTISSTNTNGNIVLDPAGTGVIDVSATRITNLAEPSADSDAATKYYVDAARSGLDIKASVRVATTAEITLSNTQTIDNIPLSIDDRVLVKNQSNAINNGIYLVKSGSWVRAADMNDPGEVSGGTFVFVEEGSVNSDTGFVVTSNGSLTTGVDEIVWTLFSSSGTLIAGNGLSKNGYTLEVNVAANGGIEISSDNLQLKSTVAGTGLTLTDGVLDVVGTTNRITANANSIDIASTYVGQSSITTLGTVTTGTWNADIIAGQYGGTGVNNSGKTITLGGNLTTSGAYATTLTVTNTTNVTLPTTGTLATLAGTEDLTNKTINSSSIGATTRGSGAFTTLASNNLVTFTDSTDAGPLGTAAVVISGGVSIAKKLYVGDNIVGTGTNLITGFDIDGGTY